MYKNELIEKMRQQIQENKEKQKVENENKKLKKELKELKAKNKKENRIGKDVDLFDKFKDEYINQKSKVIELKKEHNDLIGELDYKVYNNLVIKKNVEFKIVGNGNKINRNKRINVYHDMNRYIENRYRTELKKQGENINDYTRVLRTSQLNEIRFLIKMIFFSNKISKDIIYNSIINTLMNFNEMINIFIQLIKTNSPSDIKLLKNYFTSISFNNNNVTKKFNINNIFTEIDFYFNDLDKIKKNFDDMNTSGEKNKKILKVCKRNDKNKNGLIELNHFNKIFKEIYGNFHNNQQNKEIYDTFIVIMKNYDDLKNLDLYQLSYLNLKNNSNEQLSNINNSKYEITLDKNEIKNEKQNNIDNISNNKEEDDTKICSNFVTDLFNDVIDKANDNNDNTDNNNNDIDNICKNFVSNVFEECLYRHNNKHFYNVCQKFVSDLFDDCLKRVNNEKNLKMCNNFVEDVFDSCLNKYRRQQKKP